MKLKDKIKFWNEYRNPLYHWWKARKYFKFPKIVFAWTKYPDYIGHFKSILGCRFDALMWKTKWNSPRHERDPRIVFCFFKKWYLYIVFTYDTKNIPGNAGTYAVWEAILDYLYYRKSIGKCYYDHIWLSGCGNDATELTIRFALKKKALELI